MTRPLHRQPLDYPERTPVVSIDEIEARLRNIPPEAHDEPFRGEGWVFLLRMAAAFWGLAIYWLVQS